MILCYYSLVNNSCVLLDDADRFDQAAALLSGHGRPARTSSRPDYNKPAPLAASGLRPDDRYSAHSPSHSTGSAGGRYDDRRRHEDDRRNSPRTSTGSSWHGVGSPPPQNYGHGPPPSGYHNRPPVNRPPPTPAPPRDGNDRDALWRLFGAVDKDSM